MRRRPRIRQPGFKFSPFSKKQLQVLTWWRHPEHCKNDTIICDGSVRAGKTVVMSLSFTIWAMETFNGENLIFSGKTIGSLNRNVIKPLMKILKGRGYTVIPHRTENMIEIIKDGKVNYFYLFGGKDESSQDLVQGITAAGAFFDEVALMPRSFVNQATARCSVTGSKLWFNCNPAGPYHWFKLEWLDNLEQKKAIHIHFTMEDNPSLAQDVKDRYKRMYSGVFFQRYILGLWVMSEGIIFDNFDEKKDVVNFEDERYKNLNINQMTRFMVSVDYGTQNPTVFLLWGSFSGVWYCLKEFYHSGREGKQLTDSEYSAEMKSFTEGFKIEMVIVDPSAASFIAQLRKDGFFVRKAKNEVLDGIRNSKTAMIQEKVKFFPGLTNLFREFHSYVWDQKASERGEDKPMKEWDHAMDAFRYFVHTVVMRGGLSAGPSIY